MSLSFKLGILLLLLAVAVWAYSRWLATYRARPRQPVARRKTEDEYYKESNSEARLLSDVLSLKERSALWPEILKTLNPADDPRLRTVLLEIRWPNIASPGAALGAIERSCIAAKHSGESFTTLKILEIARSEIDEGSR